MNVTIENGLILGSEPITPADDGTHLYDSLYIESAGTIKLTFADDSIDTYEVPNYYRLTARIKRVWDDGTDATGIHGLKLYQ